MLLQCLGEFLFEYIMLPLQFSDASLNCHLVSFSIVHLKVVDCQTCGAPKTAQKTL